MRTTSKRTHPQPRLPFVSSIPPAPAEFAAGAARWERRGVLSRLVRRR
jgi:hypothetical protein